MSADTVQGVTHELKTWTDFFGAVWDGTKTFEIRKDDRDFAVGDTLLLREFDASTEVYSGRWLKVEVTYLLRGSSFALPGTVVMGLKPWSAAGYDFGDGTDLR